MNAAKHAISDLALFGGTVAFAEPLHVAQLNLPDQARFHDVFQGIFDRRYYSNHGVLAQEFEEKLCELLGVRHAVTMTNATQGLIMAAQALGLPRGSRVIVPAFTFAATVQSLTWAGLEPVFCDVDPATHMFDLHAVRALLPDPKISAILGVHLWGGLCPVQELEALASARGIPLYYDAAHAVGCSQQGRKVAHFGACSIFSFHATKVLTCAEGGCVATNDDDLAERLRNLRASYGYRVPMTVPIHGNGRFSEFQAGMGLLSLADFPANCAANAQRFQHYTDALAGIPGLNIMLPSPDVESNHQYLVLEVDEESFGLSRDTLVKALHAENVLCRRYFVPGMHRSVPYATLFPAFLNALPVTDALCSKVMQLPSGSQMDQASINVVCSLLRFLQSHAHEIKNLVASLEA